MSEKRNIKFDTHIYTYQNALGELRRAEANGPEAAASGEERDDGAASLISRPANSSPDLRMNRRSTTLHLRPGTTMVFFLAHSAQLPSNNWKCVAQFQTTQSSIANASEASPASIPKSLHRHLQINQRHPKPMCVDAVLHTRLNTTAPTNARGRPRSNWACRLAHSWAARKRPTSLTWLSPKTATIRKTEMERKLDW